MSRPMVASPYGSFLEFVLVDLLTDVLSTLWPVYSSQIHLTCSSDDWDPQSTRPRACVRRQGRATSCALAPRLWQHVILCRPAECINHGCLQPSFCTGMHQCVSSVVQVLAYTHPHMHLLHLNPHACMQAQDACKDRQMYVSMLGHIYACTHA